MIPPGIGNFLLVFIAATICVIVALIALILVGLALIFW